MELNPYTFRALQKKLIKFLNTNFYFFFLAIAAEKKQQQVTLLKQREEYVRKTTTLQRELEILRQQCNEIGKEDGRENRIVKENQKLQVFVKVNPCFN